MNPLTPTTDRTWGPLRLAVPLPKGEGNDWRVRGRTKKTPALSKGRGWPRDEVG